MQFVSGSVLTLAISCSKSSFDVESGVKPISMGQHPSMRGDMEPGASQPTRQGRVLHLVPEPMTAAERAHYARKHTTQTSTIGRGSSRALLQLKVCVCEAWQSLRPSHAVCG